MSYLDQRKREAVNGFELLSLILLLPFSAAFNGWAVKTVWNWFVPAVTGWTHIGIAQAIGLVSIGSILKAGRAEPDKTTAQRWLELLVFYPLGVLMAVGIAWVAHQVVGS